MKSRKDEMENMGLLSGQRLKALRSIRFAANDAVRPQASRKEWMCLWGLVSFGLVSFCLVSPGSTSRVVSFVSFGSFGSVNTCSLDDSPSDAQVAALMRSRPLEPAGTVTLCVGGDTHWDGSSCRYYQPSEADLVHATNLLHFVHGTNQTTMNSSNFREVVHNATHPQASSLWNDRAWQAFHAQHCPPGILFNLTHCVPHPTTVQPTVQEIEALRSSHDNCDLSLCGEGTTWSNVAHGCVSLRHAPATDEPTTAPKRRLGGAIEPPWKLANGVSQYWENEDEEEIIHGFQYLYNKDDLPLKRKFVSSSCKIGAAISSNLYCAPPKVCAALVYDETPTPEYDDVSGYALRHCVERKLKVWDLGVLQQTSRVGRVSSGAELWRPTFETLRLPLNGRHYNVPLTTKKRKRYAQTGFGCDWDGQCTGVHPRTSQIQWPKQFNRNEEEAVTVGVGTGSMTCSTAATKAARDNMTRDGLDLDVCVDALLRSCYQPNSQSMLEKIDSNKDLLAPHNRQLKTGRLRKGSLLWKTPNALMWPAQGAVWLDETACTGALAFVRQVGKPSPVVTRSELRAGGLKCQLSSVSVLLENGGSPATKKLTSATAGVTSEVNAIAKKIFTLANVLKGVDFIAAGLGETGVAELEGVGILLTVVSTIVGTQVPKGPDLSCVTSTDCLFERLFKMTDELITSKIDAQFVNMFKAEAKSINAVLPQLSVWVKEGKKAKSQQFDVRTASANLRSGQMGKSFNGNGLAHSLFALIPFASAAATLEATKHHMELRANRLAGDVSILGNDTENYLADLQSLVSNAKCCAMHTRLNQIKFNEKREDQANVEDYWWDLTDDRPTCTLNAHASSAAVGSATGVDPIAYISDVWWSKDAPIWRPAGHDDATSASGGSDTRIFTRKAENHPWGRITRSRVKALGKWMYHRRYWAAANEIVDTWDALGGRDLDSSLVTFLNATSGKTASKRPNSLYGNLECACAVGDSIAQAQCKRDYAACQRDKDPFDFVSSPAEEPAPVCALDRYALDQGESPSSARCCQVQTKHSYLKKGGCGPFELGYADCDCTDENACVDQCVDRPQSTCIPRGGNVWSRGSGTECGPTYQSAAVCWEGAIPGKGCGGCVMCSLPCVATKFIATEPAPNAVKNCDIAENAEVWNCGTYTYQNKKNCEDQCGIFGDGCYSSQFKPL